MRVFVAYHSTNELQASCKQVAKCIIGLYTGLGFVSCLLQTLEPVGKSLFGKVHAPLSSRLNIRRIIATSIRSRLSVPMKAVDADSRTRCRD